ncbi:MAG: endonuclease/exonuclease/phosphatase family protein [Flavobacteriaceae bacterium]|nr:endonuclease/exonuclease/phosphatase family protein [Flavobacteriaceae bacterium]
MKDLSFLNKIIFLINNIFALLFVASFILPYVSPKSFPLLSILSLTVPLLIFIHVLFIVYWWIIGVKKQFFLSTFCILLAIAFSYFPYKFSGKNVISGNSFSVMNFNVRLFNRYHWIDDKAIPEKISEFIDQNKPDILAIQEFYPSKDLTLNYPFKYMEFKGDKKDFAQVIYSKYKIINKGSLDFKNSSNNAIYIDFIKNSDTIRVYNLHLESLGIKERNIELGGLDEKESKKIIHQLEMAFIKQQSQVEQFLEHKNNCNYKIIICGDFNNTAYSWAYHHLKEGFKDTFLEAGKGFGKTYSFLKYPLRIDFILVDQKFKVNHHQNFDKDLSDHEPILARLSF